MTMRYVFKCAVKHVFFILVCVTTIPAINVRWERHFSAVAATVVVIWHPHVIDHTSTGKDQPASRNSFLSKTECASESLR
jgi:hypothetical protein